MTVNVQLIDMPTSVKGHTVNNSDDSYTIFINSRINQEQRILAYKHELDHIKQDDFKKSNVQSIESNCPRK